MSLLGLLIFPRYLLLLSALIPLPAHHKWVIWRISKPEVKRQYYVVPILRYISAVQPKATFRDRKTSQYYCWLFDIHKLLKVGLIYRQNNMLFENAQKSVQSKELGHNYWIMRNYWLQKRWPGIRSKKHPLYQSPMTGKFSQRKICARLFRMLFWGSWDAYLSH